MMVCTDTLPCPAPYPEQSSRGALCAALSPHGHAVVIPCYGEDPKRVRMLVGELPSFVLPIVVVNSNERSDDWVIEQNQSLLESLQGRTEDTVVGDMDGRQVVIAHLLVPSREGVGRARRQGGQILLDLIEQGLVTKPWIHWLDADSSVPGCHFYDVEKLPDTCAAAVRCNRIASTNDRVLAYHAGRVNSVVGMAASGSPWAFPVWGTGVSYAAWAYKAFGGCPAVSSAEDHLSLYAAARLGSVAVFWAPPARTSARPSGRCLDQHGLLSHFAPTDGAALHREIMGPPAQMWPVLSAIFACLERYAIEQDRDTLALCKRVCDGRVDHEIVHEAIRMHYGPWEIMPFYGDGLAPAQRLLDLHMGFRQDKVWQLPLWLDAHGYPAVPVRESIASSPWIDGATPSFSPERLVDKVFEAGARLPRFWGPQARASQL